MRTSGASNERPLMLIPVLVAAGVILLVTGADLPKTLYGVDHAIREIVASAIDGIRAMF